VRLDYPGRVKSQITNVMCQIQRFDFDYNLVVTQKLIIPTPPGLGSKPILNLVQLCTPRYTKNSLEILNLNLL
jgi:hypothetical protein